MAADLFSIFVALVVSILLVPTTILLCYLLKSSSDGSHNLRRRSGGGSGDNRNLPPSPPGLPFIGHLHLLGSLPHRSLRSIAAAHGPVVLLRFGRLPAVLVSSAAAAEEVMRTRDLAFASRPPSAMADRLLYGRDVAFAPYGEYWRQTRRICVTHLLSARRIQSFRRVRQEEAADLVHRVQRVHRVRARCASSEDPDNAVAEVNLGELLVAYANNVVSRAAFGDESSRGLFLSLSDRGREVRRVLDEFQELLATEPVGNLLPWLGWVVDAVTGLDRRIGRTFQALDALLENVIDDHRRRRLRRAPTTRATEEDFVDVLLDVSRNDEEYGVRLRTNEIKAIILDMFAAGTDTTTTVMEWAMAELVTHPRAMRQVQDEIRKKRFQQVMTEEQFEALPYLRAVIKETLRLHVPIPLLVPRAPPSDAEILGYRVPAGTRVVINAWAIARDPATWGDDAEEFAPERFLPGGAAADVDYRGQSFELLPFGAGRRGCPGVAFAERTIGMGLASLLYHFDWEADEAAATLDMSEKNGLAVHIKSGVPLRAKPWNIPSSSSSSSSSSS